MSRAKISTVEHSPFMVISIDYYVEVVIWNELDLMDACSYRPVTEYLDHHNILTLGPKFSKIFEHLLNIYPPLKTGILMLLKQKHLLRALYINHI